MSPFIALPDRNQRVELVCSKGFAELLLCLHLDNQDRTIFANNKLLCNLICQSYLKLKKRNDMPLKKLTTKIGVFFSFLKWGTLLKYEVWTCIGYQIRELSRMVVRLYLMNNMPSNPANNQHFLMWLPLWIGILVKSVQH